MPFWRILQVQKYDDIILNNLIVSDWIVYRSYPLQIFHIVSYLVFEWWYCKISLMPQSVHNFFKVLFKLLFIFQWLVLSIFYLFIYIFVYLIIYLFIFIIYLVIYLFFYLLIYFYLFIYLSIYFLSRYKITRNL